MGKRHKKNKTNVQGNHTEKQIRNNTLKIIKEVCGKLAGPNAFSQFSRICVLRIISNRYPAIRMRAGSNCDIPATQLNQLNEIFKNMLIKEQFECTTGENIPLSTYMREGLMLIHYFDHMEDLGVAPTELLKQSFAPYHRQSEIYLNAVRTVAQIMCKFCVVMSDWSSHIFVYDISLLCALGGESPNNEIYVTTIKPEVKFMKLEGHNRELVRAGWSGFEGKVNWLTTEPWKLGFKDQPGSNEAAEIYIQRHALQRLQERIGLVPGLIHEAINDTFQDKKITWHKRSEKRLVELMLMDKKLGYLVCSFNQGIIIIRSFLFLTNSGTPEGNKLSELTKLAPLDKQYLGIDTLIGFAGFQFNTDATLVELFTQAGCAGLLDLSLLTRFTKSEVRGQETEMLLKYLGAGRDITMEIADKEIHEIKAGIAET